MRAARRMGATSSSGWRAAKLRRTGSTSSPRRPGSALAAPSPPATASVTIPSRYPEAASSQVPGTARLPAALALPTLAGPRGLTPGGSGARRRALPGDTWARAVPTAGSPGGAVRAVGGAGPGARSTGSVEGCGRGGRRPRRARTGGAAGPGLPWPDRARPTVAHLAGGRPGRGAEERGGGPRREQADAIPFGLDALAHRDVARLALLQPREDRRRDEDRRVGAGEQPDEQREAVVQQGGRPEELRPDQQHRQDGEDGDERGVDGAGEGLVHREVDHVRVGHPPARPEAPAVVADAVEDHDRVVE